MTSSASQAERGGDATERTTLLQRNRPRPRLSSRSGSVSFQLPQDVHEPAAPVRIGALRATSVVVAFVLLIFLGTSNMTVMSTIQGLIAEEMDAYGQVSWFTSAYMIGQAGTSPIYGRLSQIFSTRVCILWASVLFGVGALVASQANNLTVFLLGRAVQGTGMGGIITLSIILVIQLAPISRRGLLIGLTNTAITASVSLGALVGGELGWIIGWRALMWGQTPLALVGGICLFFSLGHIERPESDGDDEKTTPQKLWAFDYAGSFLLTFSLVTLLVALSEPAEGLPLFLLAAGLLATFVLNEIYRAELPVIPISVLRSRGILLSSVAQMFYMTARWTVLFYSPIIAQAIFLWRPGPSGAMLIPTNAGFGLGGLIVGFVHIKRHGSFYLPAMICFVLFPITMLVLSLIAAASTPVWWYILVIFANGFIVGAALNYCLAHLLHLAAPEHHFISTSIMATFRGFSGSFGSAIGGGLFARTLRSSLTRGFANRNIAGKEDLIRRLLGQAGLVGRLEGVEREVASKGYEDAIRAVYLAACVVGVLAIFIQAGVGWKGPGEVDHKDADDEEQD